VKFHEFAGLPGVRDRPECREATGVVMDRLCERTSGLNLNLNASSCRRGSCIGRNRGDDTPFGDVAVLERDAVLLSRRSVPIYATLTRRTCFAA